MDRAACPPADLSYSPKMKMKLKMKTEELAIALTAPLAVWLNHPVVRLQAFVAYAYVRLPGHPVRISLAIATVLVSLFPVADEQVDPRCRLV